MDSSQEDALSASWTEVSNDEFGDSIYDSNYSQQLQQPVIKFTHQSSSDSNSQNYNALREAMNEVDAQEASQGDSTIPSTGDAIEREEEYEKRSVSLENPTGEISAAVKIKYRTTVEDAPPEEDDADLRQELGIKSDKPSSPPSILDDIITSLYTPGTQPGVITVMNFAFYGLFITLIGLAILTKFNMHVLVFLAISIGLFVSIQRFLAEIERAKKEEAKTKND